MRHLTVQVVRIGAGIKLVVVLVSLVVVSGVVFRTVAVVKVVLVGILIVMETRVLLVVRSVLTVKVPIGIGILAGVVRASLIVAMRVQSIIRLGQKRMGHRSLPHHVLSTEL